jgi:UDP-glucose 4-epimerase
MKCLVSGGGGFIGSHLVDALVARNHEVRVLDNFCTGNPQNLISVRNHSEIIEEDLLDFAAVRRAVRGVDWVFHQAALPSVSRSVADPQGTHHASATATLHLLHAAREAGVRRFIYAGSSSAYGNSARLPKRESDPVQPLSPYAAAKLAGEHYCEAFTSTYGLETVRLRYFNVFGPRQDPDSPYSAVIPAFISAMLRGESPSIFGDGSQSRDFTYVENVIQGNLLAAQAPNVAGRVFNIACGLRTSLLDLVAALNSLLGTEIQPLHLPPRPGDVLHSQADISRAREDLGYQPTVDLNEGLLRSLRHLQGQTKKRSGSRRQIPCGS